MGIIQKSLQWTFNKTPKWLISDYAVEYMKAVFKGILGDMEVKEIPIVPYNVEGNGIAEMFKKQS